MKKDALQEKRRTASPCAVASPPLRACMCHLNFLTFTQRKTQRKSTAYYTDRRSNTFCALRQRIDTFTSDLRLVPKDLHPTFVLLRSTMPSVTRHLSRRIRGSCSTPACFGNVSLGCSTRRTAMIPPPVYRHRRPVYTF